MLSQALCNYASCASATASSRTSDAETLLPVTLGTAAEVASAVDDTSSIDDAM